ncbi:MAG: fimbrial protein, partial [Plesiomonas sp.]
GNSSQNVGIIGIKSFGVFMKCVIKFVPVVIAAALMTNAAQAADGTIDFQGRLIEQTCSITVEGSVNPHLASVTMPSVSTSALSAAGMTTGRTNFEIELSNCSGSAATAAAFFDAGADVDPVSGQLLTTGSATNVRLQLLDNNANGAVIKAGDMSQLTNTSRVTIVGGKAILPYSVQYIATGAATAGTVFSSLLFSINYQ